jgi:transposase
VKEQRTRWLSTQLRLDFRRLIFIDETAAKTNMLRLRGRCPRGERPVVKAPAGHWQTSTLIQSIDHQGVRAAFVFDGATNAVAFETFVEKVLVPKLRGDEIIILDNLSSHKSSRVAELIHSTGAKIRFLPPYSPDLAPPRDAPIENIFSQLKAYLRSAAARTQEQLWNTISDGIKNILPQHCQNCLKPADTVLRNFRKCSSPKPSVLGMGER